MISFLVFLVTTPLTYILCPMACAVLIIKGQGVSFWPSLATLVHKTL